MTLLKAIAVRDDQGKIRDLYALAIVAKREAERILHHTHFRVDRTELASSKANLPIRY